MRRPSMAVLASVVLVCTLVAGCDDGPDTSAPPTSRSGGSEGSTTTSTLPEPGRFVGAWAGEKEIWGLTSEPCQRPGADNARCGVVSRTADNGASWTRVARLDVGTTPDGSGGASVTAVHFADPRHGWVYNRHLFATFNSGRRWVPVELGSPVVALDSSNTTAFALVGTCGEGVGNCNAPMRLYEGTISTGRWRFLNLGFELPPTDVGNIVVSRSGVYAVVVRGLDQVFMARTGNRRWERRSLPCPRALVAPIQGQDGLVAACRPAAPAGPVELQTSSDGGRTWAVVWQQAFPSPVSTLAVTSSGTVIGLESGDILRSVDNGMNFTSVLQAGAAPLLRFADGEHGTLLAGSPGERQLYRTSDSGATWRVVPPPPA